MGVGRRLLLPIVAGIFAATAVVPALASAQDAPPTVGIRLVDAPADRSDDPRARQYIVDHIAPGTTISRRVEISNGTPVTQVVQLYAAAASVKDANFVVGEGRSANDLTTWTSVDLTTVSPPSGGVSLATITIAVPADASPGERYGVVWAELPASVPPDGGIAAVNRVGVRMYLSVGEGGEPASDFAISAFEAQRDAEGNPSVAATVQNTGGRALDLAGELTLTNGPGGLSTGPFEVTLGTTLGVGETEPVLVVLDPALPPGPWDARIVLRSGLTQREATATITFPAAGSAGPVAASADSAGGRWWLPVLVGAAVLLGLFLLILLLRRRRRTRAAVPSEAASDRGPLQLSGQRGR